FVSVHINANNDPSLGGTSTYVYSGTGDPKQAARIKESNRLAGYVQKELLKTLGLRDVGVRSANFAVLRTSNMPAILAELAFISNLPEEKLIKTDNFKNSAAEAIAKGIGLYFSERRNA
ncbi:MAG: N-acetylmuramoyl-L-alanine amidase, partial [Desulfotomaculaceae bacterium]